MSSRSKLIVGMVVAVLLAVTGYRVMNRDMDETETPESVKTEQAAPREAKSEVATDATAEAGAYVDYSASAVTDAKGTKILFFHAPWCPQCRQLDASIKAGSVPDGVTIFKTDYDSNQALRQKYGVTIQTTLVKIDDDGKLVKKYVAYDEPTLESLTKNLLP